jgi:hypothetical protein
MQRAAGYQVDPILIRATMFVRILKSTATTSAPTFPKFWINSGQQKQKSQLIAGFLMFAQIPQIPPKPFCSTRYGNLSA